MAQATISITVNGEAKEVEATTTGVELFAEDKNIIAVKINGENRDLYTPLNDGDTVDPIALDSEDGLAIMRHSATHVMAQAVQEVYPNAKLGVGPVIRTASTTTSGRPALHPERPQGHREAHAAHHQVLPVLPPPFRDRGRGSEGRGRPAL